jgi:hypothetical protein
VSDLVKRFPRNSDDVQLDDFKRVRALDREWKARTFSPWRSMTSNESYIFLAVFAALALVALIYLLSPMSPPDEQLLYLIGVNHAVQFKSAVAQMFTESESVRKKREAFKAHVAEIIDKLDIEILAEEFSDEGKKESETREFAKDFAKALHEPFDWETARQQFDWETELQKFSKAKGIEHLLCDPDSSERKALGIEVDPRKETEADWRKREQVWLSRIADCKRKRVLFVCGDDHYDAFAQLLESNGFNVRRGAHYPISNEEFLDL